MKTIEFPGPALTIKKETLELYIHDLSRPANEAKADLPVDIKRLRKPIALENVSSLVVSDHIASKQNIFVAYHLNKPIGYLFTTTLQSLVEEIDDYLKVADREIYLYNAYVYRMFRGKHIYQALLIHVLRYYKNKSYTKALIFTTQNNINSQTGIKKVGFKCFGHIHFSNFLGRKTWQYSRRNSASQSYFMHEVCENE